MRHIRGGPHEFAWIHMDGFMDGFMEISCTEGWGGFTTTNNPTSHTTPSPPHTPPLTHHGEAMLRHLQ